MNLPRHYWSKVDKTEACWVWTGYKSPDGYGRFRGVKDTASVGGSAMAHRIAYHVLVGPIPDGLTIDHLCRNRACVNPDHMEPVTPLENMRRAAAAHTHCPNGHAYTPANTVNRPGDTHRCRTCQRTAVRESMRRQRARKKAAA